MQKLVSAALDIGSPERALKCQWLPGGVNKSRRQRFIQCAAQASAAEASWMAPTWRPLPARAGG